MLHSLLFVSAVATAFAPQQHASPDPTFLEDIVILETHPEDDRLTFREPNGESREVAKGDVIQEVEARVEKIGASTLVLSRVVTGEDGQEGTARIIVRFDQSGTTRVREYRTVPDVSNRPPRPPSER